MITQNGSPWVIKTNFFLPELSFLLSIFHSELLQICLLTLFVKISSYSTRFWDEKHWVGILLQTIKCYRESSFSHLRGQWSSSVLYFLLRKINLNSSILDLARTWPADYSPDSWVQDKLKSSIVCELCVELWNLWIWINSGNFYGRRGCPRVLKFCIEF